ncbi:hypothetical protein N431DRAFT_532272 [Stipitochalara longipes BDJ]|nr:hypothetical protein N431DRAFT_532272 [Stipitochalara longipes BDJ]
MLFSRSLSLFLSTTVAFAAKFPRHGDASGATSPMVMERELSAASLVCGSAGTDKEKPAAYSGPHASSIQDCLSKCRGSSGCQSVAFDSASSVCLLYKSPVSGNINYDASQAYQFYDISCPQGGSSGISITTVVTLTVTGPAIVATSTVVVIATPAPTTTSRNFPSTSTLVVFVTVTQGALPTSTSLSVPSTPSISSTSTSTYVVVVTVTQGVPPSSTSAPASDTNTIYASLPPTPISLPNPPTSTLPAFTLSTRTTSIAFTSSSAVIASPSPSGLLCGVNGWSASTTSFFDNTGDLGNQDACELACKIVSCGSYGFSNTTCLAYPGNVSQSVVLNPSSEFQFFDAGCVISHK